MLYTVTRLSNDTVTHKIESTVKELPIYIKTLIEKIKSKWKKNHNGLEDPEILSRNKRIFLIFVLPGVFDSGSVWDGRRRHRRSVGALIGQTRLIKLVEIDVFRRAFDEQDVGVFGRRHGRLHLVDEPLVRLHATFVPLTYRQVGKNTLL